MRVSELATALGVSEVTVRSDLTVLERQGILWRERGGAVRREAGAPAESFADRLRRNGRVKRWIAQRAATLVEDGDTVFLDGSSTAYLALQWMRGRTGLRVVTNSLETARAASSHPGMSVVLIGGSLQAGATVVVGPPGTDELRAMRFDKALVSCTGLSFDTGMLDADVARAEVKRIASSVADSVIAVIDASKMAAPAGMSPFCDLGRVDHFVVDALTPSEHVTRLRATGAQVSVCGEGHIEVYGPPEGHSGRRYRIGFANQDDEEEFPATVRASIERAAAARGDIDLVIADNRLEGQTALANAERFVRAGVDLVIEYQYHASYGEPIMARFREASIPVIAIDIPMPGATYFGVDNYTAGRIGGEAAGRAALERWGSVDLVVALGLPQAGGTPQGRLHGQLDMLREMVGFRDDQVVHIDTRANRAETHRLVTEAIHAYPPDTHIVVLGGNDEVALGAIDALEAAGSADNAVVVSQGADSAARRELLRPGTPLVGSVAYEPERYGERVLDLAMRILRREPVPPAEFNRHWLVTAASLTGAVDPPIADQGPERASVSGVARTRGRSGPVDARRRPTSVGREA